MDAHIYCFMSVAGPSAAVEAFYTTLMTARRFGPDKGWHWGFGLCDPEGVAPIINDSKVKVENRPPGESFVMMTGIWLGQDWDAINVGLAINTVASLWPELTFFFDGHPYEEYRGYRGLWQDGRCIVFDARVDDDYADRNENGDPITLYRRVYPTAERPIPLFYQHDFTSNDPLPDWHEIRQSIEGGVQDEVNARYSVQLRESYSGTWREQEVHEALEEASESARSFSRAFDERSRIMDLSTGREVEVWNDGRCENRNGEEQ